LTTRTVLQDPGGNIYFQYIVFLCIFMLGIRKLFLIRIENMIMSKPIFFAMLFAIVVAPFWLFKLGWVMRSKKAQGVMAFAGMGFAGDQIKEDYSVISFRVGEDRIWFNGLGNLPYKPGDKLGVRYQPGDVYDVRVDTFAGIWGDTLVYSGIPALILLVLFLHPLVVPWGSRIRLTARKPFIGVHSPEKLHR